MNLAYAYWTGHYSDRAQTDHHSEQNQQISEDFLFACRRSPFFVSALKGPSIIEFGCGTGELAAAIKEAFGPQRYYATDFCRKAIEAAAERHPEVNFWKFDVMKDEPFGKWDLALASNMLEHFMNPWSVIDRMFEHAPKVMVLVPYMQPVADGYDAEGGAGHVYMFHEQSFSNYHIVDFIKFKTAGWDHRSFNEPPRQIALLLSEKS